VRGMLAGNRMRDVQLRRLSVYTGAEHPHDAQQPSSLP
jgi:large subunit ribosomal protein L13